MPHRISKQIYEVLMNSKRIIVIPHQNPDGDAVGSVSALVQFLKSQHKIVDVFCATPVPEQLNFLKGMTTVSSDPNTWQKAYDTIIVCDSGDPVYAGIANYLPMQKNAEVIVIDHHPTNTYYGTINLVDTKASSTTEIVYQFFTDTKVEITKHIATSLLVGLMTDTGIFSNSGTSKNALSIASTLVRKGADLTAIRKNIIIDKRMSTLKLWGKALAKLTHEKELDVVYTTISIEDMLTCGVDEESVSGIANLMNMLKEGKAHFVFHERPDHTVKVSMRTTRDDVDVSEIAKAFGGGGHKKAAGFSLAIPLETAFTYIVPTLNKCLKKV